MGVRDKVGGAVTKVGGAVGGAVGRAAAVPKRAVVGYWRGLTYPFKGARFVYFQHPSLIRIWIFPVILVFATLVLMTWGVWHYHDALVTWLVPEPDGDGFWTDVLGFLHGALEVLVALLLFLGGLLLVVLFTSVFAAPFNDALSQKVEEIVTHRPGPPFSMKVLIRDLFRTIALELVKLLLWAIVMVPLWLFSLALPVVGQIVYAVFGFVFTAMYWSIDYVDWPASRRNKGVRYRFGMASRHFLPMFGYGTGVWLFLFVPLVNLLFMPAAVAGGTLLYLDLEGGDPAPIPGESSPEGAVEAPPP